MEKSGLDIGKILNFYVRRGFRIYPALWCALLLGLLYAGVFHGMPLPSSVHGWWGDGARNYVLSPGAFVTAFAGVHTSLKVPVWTLYIELVGSLFMPAIVWFLRRGTGVFAALLIVLAGLCLVENTHHLFMPIRYLIYFALGAAMTRLPAAFARFNPGLGVVAAAAVVCFLAMWFARWLFDARFLENYNAPVPALIEGVAAAGLIGLIYASPAIFPFLRSRWSIWLGDISYSLYLAHLPVLGLVAGFGGEIWRLGLFTGSPLVATVWLTLATLAISLVLSALIYRFVEIPGIRLGKWICNAVLEPMLGRWRPAPAAP